MYSRQGSLLRESDCYGDGGKYLSLFNLLRVLVERRYFQTVYLNIQWFLNTTTPWLLNILLSTYTLALALYRNSDIHIMQFVQMVCWVLYNEKVNNSTFMDVSFSSSGLK